MESKKSTYVIINFTVIDYGEYLRYVKFYYPHLKKYDGKLLIAGGNITIGSGELDGNEIVLIEFPSWSNAINWYNDEEHNKILPHFHVGCKFHTVSRGLFTGMKTIRKGFFIFVENTQTSHWHSAMN